jgi:hypothetical protein
VNDRKPSRLLDSDVRADSIFLAELSKLPELLFSEARFAELMLDSEDRDSEDRLLLGGVNGRAVDPALRLPTLFASRPEKLPALGFVPLMFVPFMADVPRDADSLRPPAVNPPTWFAAIDWRKPAVS